jgi:hypothetical protein
VAETVTPVPMNSGTRVLSTKSHDPDVRDQARDWVVACLEGTKPKRIDEMHLAELESYGDELTKGIEPPIQIASFPHDAVDRGADAGLGRGLPSQPRRPGSFPRRGGRSREGGCTARRHGSRAHPGRAAQRGRGCEPPTPAARRLRGGYFDSSARIWSRAGGFLRRGDRAEDRWDLAPPASPRVHVLFVHSSHISR